MTTGIQFEGLHFDRFLENFAELAVVLPIPISPVARRSTPLSASCAAVWIPIVMASSASVLVMAGSLAKFRVPRAIFLSSNSGCWENLWLTPISTTSTSAFCCLARTFGGSTIKEILHHLGSDFGGVSANALFGDPMIRREYNDRFPVD